MIKYIHDAMAAKREALENKDDKGFTLIELLVVVLILGILAAIAIPVFIGQQQQADDGAAKANLANAKVAVMSYYAAGTPATALTGGASSNAATVLATYGWPSGSPAVTLQSFTDIQTFCLTAPGGTVAFWTVTAGGTLTSNATAACP